VFRAFKRYLFYGTRGTEVSLLQALLKQLGFFHFPRVTGYFGPYTRAAVRRFQAAHNIEQVGTVGPKTRAALNALP
jgi:peptidoglycan hydrolase-like protein with peptidoglycan-binding domain